MRLPGFRCPLAFLALSLTVAACASDYEKRTIQVPKTLSKPKIDGDLSDEAWKSAAKAETFIDASTSKPAVDQTTAYITSDEEYIYVAFDCKESQPASITARETVRDSKFQGNGPRNKEDNVEFAIDTFLTHNPNEVSGFSVNAIGTPSASLAGGRGNKAEWKGDWEAAAKRTATGWTAEMRIPWKSLNYPTSNKPISMGVNFFRFQDRTKILSAWSDMGPQGFWEKEGVASGLVVPQNAFRPTLSLLPYVLTQAELKGGSVRAGVDARYTVTPQLTAVGSLKPDFSTVEGAVESIQFSRTERFVPDRRPFFLEGNDYFNTGTNLSDIGAFFYPRRIRSFDAGVKLYGKLSPANTIGLLDTLSFEGRNDLVARFTHDYSPTSQGGFFVSNRLDGHDRNTVVMTDQHSRWGKAGFEGIVSTSIGPDAGGGAHVASATYQDKGWLHALQYHDISSNFVAKDGFIPNTGYKGITEVSVWGAPWRHGYFRHFQVIAVPVYWWHEDGKVFQTQLYGQLQLDTRSDYQFRFEANRSTYDDQKDETFTLGVTKGITNRFSQIGVDVQTGRLGGHKATFITPVASFRVFKKLDINYGGALLNLQGVDQQHILSANYEISPTRSIGGRLVTHNRDTNAYLFYHNSGGRGTELYFLIGDPNAERFVRKLSLKLVFAT